MKKHSIGDVTVFLGMPENGNPYRGYSAIGFERHAALVAFRDQVRVTDYKEHGSLVLAHFSFWYAPCTGGAKRILDPSKINWSGCRDNPDPGVFGGATKIRPYTAEDVIPIPC